MSSLLLDIEIGLSELLLSFLVLFGTYLAWQWWNAQKVGTSGVTGLAPMNLKGTAGSKANSNGAGNDAAKLPLSIFFGSQSGTAETFAHELAEEGKLFGFKAVVHDLQDFDFYNLREEQFCVFLMATFGEGDPTDNATDFYKWVNDSQRQKEEMKGVTYAVFALGNRQYEHCS
jgi:NADPH-ferrihemoprotein reductase